MKIIQGILFTFLSIMMSSGLSAAYASEAVTASLQASANKQVLQDEVRVVFAKEAKGNSAAEVNRVVAQAIEQAREAVKNSTGFTLSNGMFRTSSVYNKDGRTEGWQGRGELVLISKDFAAAEGALGILGSQLAISSIQLSLSAATRKKEEQALLTEVAQAFRHRAQAAAVAFGFKSYKIISLELNNPSRSSDGPVLMRSAGPMSAPPTGNIKLSLEPAQVLVNVDISGKVLFE